MVQLKSNFDLLKGFHFKKDPGYSEDGDTGLKIDKLIIWECAEFVYQSLTIDGLLFS